MMPLLVSDPGVDPVLRFLQGVLHLGFILLEGGLQRDLDLGLGLPEGGLDSLYALLDDPLEGFQCGWVHPCKEKVNVVLGLVLPGRHGGRQMFLPDLSLSRLPCRYQSMTLLPAFWTE